MNNNIPIDELRRRIWQACKNIPHHVIIGSSSPYTFSVSVLCDKYQKIRGYVVWTKEKVVATGPTFKPVLLNTTFSSEEFTRAFAQALPEMIKQEMLSRWRFLVEMYTPEKDVQEFAVGLNAQRTTDVKGTP